MPILPTSWKGALSVLLPTLVVAFCASPLVCAEPAQAQVVVWNPELVTIEAPDIEAADGLVEQITIVHCDETTTVHTTSVEADFVTGLELPVAPEDDVCRIEIKLAAPMSVSSAQSGSYTLSIDTLVLEAEATKPSPSLPFTVTEGSFSGDVTLVTSD